MNNKLKEVTIFVNELYFYHFDAFSSLLLHIKKYIENPYIKIENNFIYIIGKSIWGEGKLSCLINFYYYNYIKSDSDIKNIMEFAIKNGYDDIIKDFNKKSEYPYNIFVVPDTHKSVQMKPSPSQSLQHGIMTKGG